MVRPTKTLEELLASGTFRHDRHGHLLPPGGLAGLGPVEPPPEPPAGMSASGWAEWVVLVGSMGEVRRADSALLLEVVRWRQRAGRIDEALAKVTPGGKEYGDLLGAADTATGMLLALSQRFGLTPADRAKLAKRTGASASSPAGAKPKVATRPRTTLDAAPPPAGA